jgi:uroporphyrin-III C-methyltransferase
VSVFLVGAGPGDADLLTLRAARLLAQADVVVHDRLVDASVLALISDGVEQIDVGKRPGCSHSQALINELLVSLGKQHACVVRLKGGDPFIFGRGGEEFEFVTAAGISCEVVPGVTSALSGPLAAGISLTHRGISQGVTVVTGHTHDGQGVDFKALANPQLSLVVLMGVTHRATIAEQLIEGGLSAETDVAVIERAWTEDQRVLRGPLWELASLEISSPAVIVVGPAARLELCEVSALAKQARG